ncbi:MAG: DegV family protein [Anaerolineaceae bacterium]|nr:DegV family protein [Anaerolineaceae bacterium]
MSKIAIVTDSTATFPYQQVGDVPIASVPLNLIWGDEVQKDGIDIKPEEFYERLQTSPVHPTTSQPTPKEFLEVFQKLMDDGYEEIICIVISGALSGTYNSAVQAVHMLGEVSIEVIDSKMTSVGLYLIVNEVANAINSGASLSDCVAVGKSACDRVGLYFTVSTLEYLIKGGRLSMVAGAVGNLLQIRPILALEDGRIVSKDKTRTFKRATRMLMEQVKSDVAGKQLVSIAGIWTDNYDFVNQTLKTVLEELGSQQSKEPVILPLSPVIGVHTGPGTFGIAYLTAEE